MLNVFKWFRRHDAATPDAAPILMAFGRGDAQIPQYIPLPDDPVMRTYTRNPAPPDWVSPTPMAMPTLPAIVTGDQLAASQRSYN